MPFEHSLSAAEKKIDESAAFVDVEKHEARTLVSSRSSRKGECNMPKKQRNTYNKVMSDPKKFCIWSDAWMRGMKKVKASWLCKCYDEIVGLCGQCYKKQKDECWSWLVDCE